MTFQVFHDLYEPCAQHIHFESTPLNAIQFEKDLSIAVMPQQQLKTLSHTMLVTTALKKQFEKMRKTILALFLQPKNAVGRKFSCKELNEEKG